jgi:hypothetical protein
MGNPMKQRVINGKNWNIVGGYHILKKFAQQDLSKAKKQFHHAHIRQIPDPMAPRGHGYEVVARQRRKRR